MKPAKTYRQTGLPPDHVIRDLKKAGSFEQAASVNDSLAGAIDPVNDTVQKVWRQMPAKKVHKQRKRTYKQRK